MRIIVTGASGFIGKNLILSFPPEWQITALFYNNNKFFNFPKERKLKNVKSFQCDLREEKDVENLFSQVGNDFDVCVYLSAKVDIPGSVIDPVSDMQFNVQSILNFLRHFRGGKFIYMSSGAVYDGLIGKTDPEVSLSPTLPYAISKYTSELYVKSYHKRKRSFDKYVILRFFGAYGPYESEKKIFSRLIQSLYVKRTKIFTIYGDGKNLIDAMYIEDAVQGLLKVIKSKKANLTLDFVKGNPLTIKELVNTTANILGIDNLKIKKEGVAHEHNLFYADPDLMYQNFDFYPRISYEDGIKNFIKFLEKRK
jgi:nucleoside-diphosphate-sugar epimerase